MSHHIVLPCHRPDLSGVQRVIEAAPLCNQYMDISKKLTMPIRAGKRLIASTERTRAENGTTPKKVGR